MALNIERKQQGEVIIESALHNSSNILKTSYNYSTEQLRVTFKRGAVYGYTVPVKLYEEFKVAKSPGTFLNANIKGKVKFTNVGTISKELLTEIENKVASYIKKANE